MKRVWIFSVLVGFIAIGKWQFTTMDLMTQSPVAGAKFISPNTSALYWSVGLMIYEIKPPLWNIGDKEIQWKDCLRLSDFTRKIIKGNTNGAVVFSEPVTALFQSSHLDDFIWDAYIEHSESILKIVNSTDMSGTRNSPEQQFCDEWAE